MPLELLEQICQNLAVVKRNIKGIEFAGLGEPLLHGKIDQALLLIRSRFPNVPFRLFSNGLVLKAKTDLILKTLTKSDDKLVVSLNSADAESYARLNNADYFNLICRTSKLFSRRKTQDLLKLSFNLWVRIGISGYWIAFGGIGSLS